MVYLSRVGSTGWWAGMNIKRGLKALIPAALWIGAVAAALSLYPRRFSTGSVIGYAEDLSITMTNVEPGLVRNLGAKLHEFVEPGDVLVRMDDREDRLHLITLSKDLERLQNEVESERIKLNLDQTNVEINAADLARRYLTDRESAHIQYLSALVTQASDQSRLTGMLIEHEILQRLYKTENAGFRELNNYETEVEAVRARIESNERNIDRMLKAFVDADKRWYNFNNKLEVPVDYEAVLRPIRLAVDVREREIEELTFRIDQRVLRSPIHGQVTAVFVQSGDRVQGGDPLVVISPVGTQRIVAYLPENKATVVSVGETVSLYPTAPGPEGPRRLVGEVTSVSDAVREVPIRYRRLPNWPSWGREVVVSVKDESLLPGEAVSLVFTR
ncbi:MAG: hypothetical protein DCC65_00625 [Planctomycetota bacterium]|nr:MAG: hypothetical protein DCC65_00625 [Planctomycetota bacterium]